MLNEKLLPLPSLISRPPVHKKRLLTLSPLFHHRCIAL